MKRQMFLALLLVLQFSFSIRAQQPSASPSPKPTATPQQPVATPGKPAPAGDEDVDNRQRPSAHGDVHAGIKQSERDALLFRLPVNGLEVDGGGLAVGDVLHDLTRVKAPVLDEPASGS